MATKTKSLDWSSATCQLVWQSPKVVKDADQIYIKLWGLVHTINSTNEFYQQQLTTANPRQIPIIQAHISAKQAHYPSDNFPLIAFHPNNKSYHEIELKKGQLIEITFVFGGKYEYKAQDWLNWFAERLQLENTGFSLQATPTLTAHSQKLPSTSPTQLDKIACTDDNADNTQEISFFFDTPCNLTTINKQEETATAQLSKAEQFSYLLLRHSKKRLLQWFPTQKAYIDLWFRTYQPILLASPLCSYQLYEKYGIQSQSKSSKRKADGSRKVQFHKGTAGWLILKGAWTQIGEFWQIMQSIHLLGQRTNINGLGYIIPIDNAPQPPISLWQRYISQKTQIRHAIDEVFERFSLEPELDKKGKIIEEELLCEQLYHELTTGSYCPRASHAFYIAKPNGGSRMIEQLAQRDMVVHRLVFDSVAKIIDQYQSPLSLGYRKGYSRQMARDKIQQLINDGFSWVVEVDIEAFFDNVPYDKLWQQLHKILPQREQQTIALIQQLMTAPYEIQGKKPRGMAKQLGNQLGKQNAIIERTKGLMQGSPLSPPLANLYLAQLDHEISHEHLAFIRYADDMLIFCRQQDNAIEIKQWLSEQLQGLALNLSLEKTHITEVTQGFEFLGYHFDKEGNQDKSLVPILRQRKPIMITGNHKYLGVNGNALEVRERRPSKNKKSVSLHLVEIIPLRRISQLIVMGNHSLSSPLLSACAKAKVTVHIVNRYGLQLGTMTPSNADFYSISSKQYQRHQALKASEIHAIATDIICAKLNNYQTWIYSSYRKGDNQIIKQLNQLKDKATASITAQELMGYEGQSAKICFQRLQNCMIESQQSAFKSRRRSRGGVDRLNSLLNFGYYWLFTRISALLHSHGLNPYLSYLHTSNQDYETLVYDLMEMFRVQVDKTVLRVINRKQITENSFRMDHKKGWKLTNQALHLFTNQLQATFSSKINQTYLDDIILIQVRTLVQWAVEGKSLVWFYWYSERTNKLLEMQ